MEFDINLCGFNLRLFLVERKWTTFLGCLVTVSPSVFGVNAEGFRSPKVLFILSACHLWRVFNALYVSSHVDDEKCHLSLRPNPHLTPGHWLGSKSLTPSLSTPLASVEVQGPGKDSLGARKQVDNTFATAASSGRRLAAIVTRWQRESLKCGDPGGSKNRKEFENMSLESVILQKWKLKRRKLDGLKTHGVVGTVSFQYVSSSSSRKKSLLLFRTSMFLEENDHASSLLSS